MNKKEYINSQFEKVDGRSGALEIRSEDGSETHWIVLDAKTIREINTTIYLLQAQMINHSKLN